MNASYAPDIPVHTELSILHIVHFVYLYILFFIIRVLSCRTVELLSLKQIPRMCKHTNKANSDSDLFRLGTFT